MTWNDRNSNFVLEHLICVIFHTRVVVKVPRRLSSTVKEISISVFPPTDTTENRAPETGIYFIKQIKSLVTLKIVYLSVSLGAFLSQVARCWKLRLKDFKNP